MADKIMSIIVPCYNVEKYIDRCFDSIEKQTIGLDKIELIFVNDASTDNTFDKLTSYEQKYPEDIILVNLEKNGGLGAARNVAFQYVTAPYVGYIDSDDWVEPYMYERMLVAIEKYDCDFVQCRWDFAKDENNRKMPKKAGEDGFMNLSNPDIRKKFVGSKISLVTLWDKVFKRDFLIENDIYCPEGLRHEDFLFTYLVFLYAKSCYCLEDICYHYYINPNGIVQQKGKEYHFDQMIVLCDFWQTCVDRGLMEWYKELIEWMFLEQYYVYMLWLVFEQFPERSYDVYLEMKERIYKWIPGYKDISYRKWECNQFDDVMLKMLDYDLSKEQFENLRDQLINKIGAESSQEF